MGISTYGDLKAAVANWLNRKDLTTRIPDFIALAELQIFRELRIPEMEATAALVVASDYSITLPTRFVETINLRETGKHTLGVIERGTMLDYIALRPETRDPVHYARDGSTLLIWPFNVGKTMQLKYYQTFAGQLINEDDTHSVLTAAADVYLFGALAKAQPYLSRTELEQLPIWVTEYRSNIDALHDQRDNAAFAGGPAEVSGNAYAL